MKTKPVFSLNRRCSAAMRRIAAFVDQRIEAEKARIASEFRELRRVSCPPSASHAEQEPTQ